MDDNEYPPWLTSCHVDNRLGRGHSQLEEVPGSQDDRTIATLDSNLRLVADDVSSLVLRLHEMAVALGHAAEVERRGSPQMSRWHGADHWSAGFQ